MKIEELANMEYPGRFIILGQTADRKHNFAAYGITGRSDSSQARSLAAKSDNTVDIKVTDPEQLMKGNPALLLYPATAHVEGLVAVSNGAQTSLIEEAALNGVPVEDILPAALSTPAKRKYNLAFGENGLVVSEEKTGKLLLRQDFRERTPEHNWVMELLQGREMHLHPGEEIDIASYEPDDPNYTPRIAAATEHDIGAFGLLRRGEDGECIKTFSAQQLVPGIGFMMATYSGENKNPLPSFQGDPLDVEMPVNDVKGIANLINNSLAPEDPKNDFRVALAITMIDRETCGLDTATYTRGYLQSMG